MTSEKLWQPWSTATQKCETSIFVRGEGNSTAAAVTLDTVADESRKKMADGVARSPSRLCSIDRNICCYGDALSTIFLLACFCALLPTFRFSFLFSFFSYFFSPCIPVCLSSSCPFGRAAAICYSQQVRILQYVFFLLVSSAPYPISEFFCFFIRVVFLFCSQL